MFTMSMSSWAFTSGIYWSALTPWLAESNKIPLLNTQREYDGNAIAKKFARYASTTLVIDLIHIAELIDRFSPGRLKIRKYL